MTNFVDFGGGFDPAIEAALTGGQRRREESHLPRQDRRKKAKEKAKGKARLARRVNWDLPPDLKQRIKQIADDHLVPESQVAGLLLLAGLRQLDRGDIDLDDYKIISRSPRYEFNLDLTLGKPKKPG